MLNHCKFLWNALLVLSLYNALYWRFLYVPLCQVFAKGSHSYILTMSPIFMKFVNTMFCEQSYYTYDTGQFKLDRIHVHHGLDTTRFALYYYTSASMYLDTRLMKSHLLFNAPMYTLGVCMIVCRCMRACQESTHQIWIVCIWHACKCKPRSAL